MEITLRDAGVLVGSVLGNTLFFIVAQTIVLRSRPPRRLLVVSAMLVPASTIIFLAVQFLMARQLFPSFPSFLNYSAVVFIGSLGFCGLFTFLGPATADRSATAHLLTYLHERGGRVDRLSVLEAFDPAAFVEKRFKECMSSGIISRDSSHVSLTHRGTRIATIYRQMARLCRLDRLPDYCHSFQARTQSR